MFSQKKSFNNLIRGLSRASIGAYFYPQVATAKVTGSLEKNVTAFDLADDTIDAITKEFGPTAFAIQNFPEITGAAVTGIGMMLSQTLKGAGQVTAEAASVAVTSISKVDEVSGEALHYLSTGLASLSTFLQTHDFSTAAKVWISEGLPDFGKEAWKEWGVWISQTCNAIKANPEAYKESLRHCFKMPMYVTISIVLLYVVIFWVFKKDLGIRRIWQKLGRASGRNGCSQETFIADSALCRFQAYRLCHRVKEIKLVHVCQFGSEISQETENRG